MVSLIQMDMKTGTFVSRKLKKDGGQKKDT
jgi:hypothetical protein